MVLEQKNIENYMHMHLYKNFLIEARKWDPKIEELISHFSLHVANGEMKYYSAVRGLEEYILINIEIFNGTYEDWKRRKKAELRRKKAELKGQNPKKINQNRSKRIQIKQYVMDAIDYYDKVREKYDKEQEVKYENMRKSFDETRKYMGH